MSFFTVTFRITEYLDLSGWHPCDPILIRGWNGKARDRREAIQKASEALSIGTRYRGEPIQ